MKPSIIKTRIELYIPYKPQVYNEVVNDLIDITGKIFGGCTILENNPGWYLEDPKTGNLIPDKVTILLIDVVNPAYDIERLIKNLTEYVNKTLKEDVLYYSYYEIKGADTRIKKI